MTDTSESAVDIPDPDAAPPPPPRSTADVDPGGDEEIPEPEPGLGEDPRYDAGAWGTRPDIAEDDYAR